MRYFVTEQMDDGTLAVVADTVGDPVVGDPAGHPEREPGDSPFMYPDNIARELVSADEGRRRSWTREGLLAEGHGDILEAFDRGDESAYDRASLSETIEGRIKGAEADLRLTAKSGNADAAELLRSGTWEEQVIWLYKHSMEQYRLRHGGLS